MNAESVINVLAAKHSEDVFVKECKTGPTQAASYSRFDAWVMAKSWANPLCTGYEVKVSRSDFVQDEKWYGYLPYCNQFYFVCPSKLIDPSEIGEQAGLIYICGSRAITKKKAPYRDVQIPESIFRYILMCRARIGGDWTDAPRQDRLEQWKRWLAERKEKRELGWQVSRSIRDHVSSVETESHRLKRENDSFLAIRESLLKLGLIDSTDRHVCDWQVNQRIAELTDIIPSALENNLRAIGSQLGKAIETIDRLKLERKAA